MAKASPLRDNFNAGVLSPRIMGRVSLAKYASGCERLENAIPLVQGPATKRPGTRFVAEVKDSSKRTWLARFEFNTTQAFVLEFGDSYIRFFTDHGALLTGAVSAYSGATYYTTGDMVTSGSITYYCKTATLGNAPPNATYWHAMTGSTYEIPSPYTAAELTGATYGEFTLSMAPSGDVIYIAHPSHPVQKLQRYSNTRWIMADANFTWGPFKTTNTDRAITVYASASSGAITLQASSGIFQSGHVGSLFYMEPADLSQIKPWTAGQEFKNSSPPNGVYRRSEGRTYQCTTAGTPTAGKVWRTGPNKPVHTYGTESDGGGQDINGTNVEREGLDWLFVDGGRGYVRITGFVSSTQVNAQVLGDWPLPFTVVGSTNATWRYAFGAFSDVEGYPQKLTFFRERLALWKDLQGYFSCAGDFENMATRDDSGNVVADRAITVTLTSDQASPAQWLSPGQALLIGTDAREFALSEMTTNEAFGPGNVKIEEQSSEGSRPVAPIRVDTSTLVVQRSGRKMMEVAYSFEKNGFVPHNMSVLADHVTLGGVGQMAWHNEPYVAAWAARGDGTLLGFTFNREQDVLGWHPHPLGGGGIVESLVVTPAPDGSRDELWMIVRRTINGATKRYVEYMEKDHEDGDDQADAFYVDCGLTYAGTATTSITGLDHLEGQTVRVLGDGAPMPSAVVTGGAITLGSAVTKAQVGLGYDMVVLPTRIEAGAADGTAQGKTKRINRVVARFLNTLGVKIGPSMDKLDDVVFRDTTDPLSAALPLFTGDREISFDGDYDFDGRIYVVSDQPTPATLVALFPQVTTQDR